MIRCVVIAMVSKSGGRHVVRRSGTNILVGRRSGTEDVEVVGRGGTLDNEVGTQRGASLDKHHHCVDTKILRRGLRFSVGSRHQGVENCVVNWCVLGCVSHQFLS